MTPEQQAFEDALKADRFDELTHRVYADWLEESGSDDEAAFHRLWTADWQRAWDWTREWCKRVNLKHAYFLEEARKHLADPLHEIDVTLGTSNATMDEDMAEVWSNAATVLRMEAREGGSANPFTCGDNCFPSGLDWEDDNAD